jgi:hypothetical protein
VTAWREFTAADFDISQAPKRMRQAAEAGQDALFTNGTPTRTAKPATPAPELAGQFDLFGDPAEHTAGLEGGQL